MRRQILQGATGADLLDLREILFKVSNLMSWTATKI